MEITKFGHSCLLIEKEESKVLFDPGEYSAGFDTIRGIDAIVVTHEHGDHVSTEHLRQLTRDHPGIEIYSVPDVQTLLSDVDMACSVVRPGEVLKIGSIKLQGFGEDHAVIHPDIKRFQNRGFLVDEQLFITGDSLEQFDIDIEVLALPLAAPWMKISEAIDFARAIKPKKVIPVHDGIWRGAEDLQAMVAGLLSEDGIEMLGVNDGRVVSV